MSGDKFDQLYNALKADGAVSGSRANFRNFVYASGKHGYLNRKKLYDALHADGAVSSKSYEEFAQRLGLHATNPQPRVATSQPQQQASRPQTAAQMAISQGYRKQQHQQPVDYLHRPQSQRGKAPVGAPKNASPFVQSLYEIDNAKKGADYPVSYSSPRGVQQVYQQNQQVRKQAAKTAADHIANDEYRRQSQPMIDNGTVGVMKPMGEIEQEMSDSASKFVDANLGDYINNAVLSEQNAAAQRGLDAANNVPLSAGAGGMGLMVKGMAYNKEVDPDLMAKHLTDNARNGFLKMFQDPNFVAKVENEATRLGVTPEAYMESIIPHLKDRLATSLQQSEYQKALPKNMLDNIANRFIDSNTIGKALRLATQTRGQRILSEQASAATAEGKNPYYKGGTVENVAADVAGMVADPIFGASAKLGGAVSGKLIGNSTKIGALMANGNLAQRLGLSGVQAVTSGGVTGFTFGATSGAIQNFSTGEDTSLGGTLKAMLASGASEAGSFATMSLAGVPLGQFGRSIGLKSVKTTPLTKDWFKYGSAKIGMEAAKTYMEGMGMYLGGYVSGKIEGRNQEFSLFDGTLESLPTAIGFRLTHLAEGLKGKRYDKNGKPLNWWNSTMVKFNEFLTSDKAKVSQYMMTEGEKQQIMNSIDETNAANPGLFGNVFDAAMKAKTELKTTGGILEKPFIGEPTSFGDVERDMKVVETVYDKIIADPNVSWDAKAKFSAMVMGVMPSSRPLMDYVLFTNEVVMKDNLNRGTRKYINEYSKYGELLSKREYTDADEKDKALYTMKAYKEQARLWNAISAVTNIDKNNYDMQNDFYMQGIKNAVSNADIRAFVDGLGIKGSAVEREFTNYAMEKGNVLKIFDSVAKQYGMETADLVKAFNKSAMRRTDREQEACIHLRQIMEFTAFPPNKVHAEQSNLNGKDVASDNNLGTEQPNGEAVKQELNGLRQAEAEMDVLMRDNDVFSQNFKKLQSQGLTNPQIYDWMVQNGLTQEQLEPFAHYINANARVLGMQEATKQKIEEVVSGVVQDWSYKGELNGKKMNGEQVVYVQDSDGRVLIVGSGDVAFDPTTGRAKEDVGDLLICLDPNTKEMVYLKTDDVTFMRTQMPEDFANEYRQRLQMINSQPYNEAAQEQAMQDAAKPQPKEETQHKSENGGKNGELAPQDNTTSAKVSTTSPKDNTTKEDLVPQEQPQQTRKFADGTDVPMTTDRKGRPTPDYGAMKPEQAAEILSQDLGDSAEPYVDAQIKQAEKAVKDAEKMKIDMSGEPNDVIEQQKAKAKTIEAAKKQLEQAQNIKKAMTAKAVAETMGKPTEEKVEGANEASSEVAKKFQNAPRLQGNHVSKRLPNGDKISGHYEIVPAESLTPSHDVMNDYKKSEGFPVDAEGRTINDRDYEHDKAAQQTTDQMAQKYSGQAISQVPTVSDEGIVYDGNGRTMAGQKAAKNGTDAEYIEDLMDNAQNYGFTKEQIEQSGIEHPRLVMVTDERLPYDTATFSMFNRNEKKTQSNTEQAVAKAKTLTSDEVGAIVADIEGNGSLDAFFNNSKAINDLVKTLVSKGVIGQNEVAGFMDGPDRLSAQGKEYVKNLLLGSVFKPETIRMLGVDSKIKNAAINGIRAIMDNLKLGDYSLRDEIDQAIQLLYEAGRNKMSVDDLLKQSSAFEENARDRFPMMAQAMAQALEGKASTFRELMSEYNNIAKNYNTNEGALSFYEMLTPEQLVAEFLKGSKAIKENNIKLYGNETGRITEKEGGNDVAGNEKLAEEAGGAAGTAEPERNDEWFDQSVEKLKTAKDEERKQILDDMAEYVKDYAKQNGYDEPEVYKTKEELLDAANSPSERKNIENALKFGGNYAAYYENGKVHIYLGSTKDSKDLARSFAHEYVHNDNAEDPSRVNMLVYSVENGDIKRTDLEDVIELVCGNKYYRNEAARLESFGEDPIRMLADEALAHIVQEMYAEGEDVVSQITSNPTLQKIAQETFKFRENERRSKQGLSENGNQESKRTQSVDRRDEGSVRPVREDSNGKSENAAGRGSESGVRGLREADEDKPNSVGFTPKQIREHQASVDEKREAYIKALQDGKSAKDVEDAATKYEFAFKDHQNMMGVMDEASVEDLWKKELEKAKSSVNAKATIPERKQAILDKIASGTVKKKDEAWGMLAQAEELLAEHYGIPYDEYGGRQRTKSTTVDLILNHYTKGILDKITDEPIPAATEKQMKYLMKLAKGEHLWESALEGMIPNKKQASWLIDAMKGLDDEYLLSMHPDEIEEREREIYKGIDLVRKANGANAYDWDGMRLLPKEEKPDPKFNPIEAAAEDFKKEHPMTEDEIMSVEGLDDEAKYTAIDYLNGEDDSEIARICYEQAYKNRPSQGKTLPKPEQEVAQGEAKNVSSDPMEGIKNAAEGFEKEKAEKDEKQKTATQKVMDVINASNERAKKKADVKKFKAERDKETADLMQQFLDAAKDRKDDGSGKLFSLPMPLPSKALKWMDRHLTLTDKQKEILPKLLTAIKGSMYARIKEGVYDLEDVMERVRKDFAFFFGNINKDDANKILAEAAYKGRYTDPETGERMKLSEYAERERKNTPEHKEKLVGDSKDAEDRKQKEATFINKVKTVLSLGGFKNGIVGLRKIAESSGLKDVKDTDLQELAETAIVSKAREILSSPATSNEKKFELIKQLYQNQPSLNQRDSERVMRQQYSTPAPYAFLADMYVKGGGKEVKSALEPSAGNGMLTIGLPMDVVHVNDIDAQRLANLRRQGFKNVTSQDGTQPFADKDVDVVVTNPPFGSATPKEYDGYKISSLEGQMAINALESMKNDGRAAIIIGGKTEYAKNGSLNPKDKAFLGYLYSHYNVEDVINVDGSLYAKQGTTYPTRIILINGRRKFDPENKVYPPVEKNARAESVKDYDELYKRINDDILRSKDKSVDIHGEEKRKGDNAGDRTNVSDSTKENGGRVGRMGDEGVSDRTPANPKQTELDTSTRPVEQREDANGGTTESASDGNSNPDTRGGQTSVPQSERTDGSSGRGDNSISGGSNTSATDNGTDGRERGVRLQSSDVQSVSNTPTQPKEEKKQTLTTEKVAYTPNSHSMSLGAVVPARQKEALETVLNKLGDADQYLVDNLGYNDKEDLYAHLAAEQVDAVALGLKQMEKGNGFIIGDQTGIGKGRQAAAIIRYAVKQGRIPVSFTIKPNLFSDTYRDLTDIGSPELRPFILASSKDGNIKENYDEEVKGLDGRVTKVRKQRIIYNVPSTTETQRVLKYIAENGKLPEGYDYILTTYSQIRTGLQEYKGGKWKDKKKINAADRNGQLKRDAIEKLAENSIFILDESHDAAGEGSGSAFIQKVLPKAKGVTFLSATYAKTPDAMKLYALKTDLGSKSKDEKDEKDDASWKILNAIKKGGTVFQEIMSQALTRSGQMIRRERDMTGVTIDWNPLTEDETEIQAQRDKFDNIFGIFNDILNFQRTYVDAKLGEMSDDAALIQGSVDHTPGTKDMGIGNVTFASKAYNVVQQALFSIKAEKVADYAIEAIKNGEKPVIAVNNTMEGMTDEYPMGEVMDMPDLNTTLMKGLEGILRYTEKNEYGDRDNKVLRLEELGEEAVARYNEIKEKIASATSGLSISPIDVIKHRLEQAGYRVGELTGRNTEFVYNEDGKVVRQKRTDTNKNALADRFNNGDLDVLILNRSASTGISLHASTKFKDQRQRTMIFAQMQGNINEEVQMRGRIDRTGQVRRGKYVYLVSSIPAEQRLMMMFKNKLKSLDANTTSSQKSKFNEVDVQDFTNKYGDEIVLQYMAQHPEYYNKLADPLGWGFMEYAKDGLSLGELRKNTKDTVSSPAYEVMKRLTLLPVKEQEVVLKDISDAYAQKIKQLNDMGMNDLEITDMPLEAKTLKREVWKEGSDPNGDNAFADNTYIETVEMNVLKKPMKAEEVQEAQKKMFGGKDYETWRSDKIAEIKEAQAAKIEETKAKMAEQMEKKVAKAEENTRKSLEKQNDKVQKKIDKGTQLAPGEHILTEEEIKTRISDVVADVKKKLLEKQSEAIANINTKYEMFIGPLYVCDPNKTVSVPSDWYMEDNATSSYPEFARVIGFKYDKNYNLGSSSIVFATTDSRKRVEIPLTRPKVLERIDTDTERFAKECKVITMDSWDRMIPKKDRTTGRIITGNMLEALADNNSIGHLISYTTDDGKVKQGILVPDSVSTEEITGNMPIAKAYNWFTKKEGGTELKSTDGKLRIAKNFGSMYTIYVPASRKEGGKYYLNQELLGLVHGHNFQSKGNNFWATFDADKLHDVLHVLNSMDVKVKTPNDFEESRAHYRTTNGEQGNDAQSIVANHIANVSEKVGVKANEVNSADEITNPRVKADIEAGKNVTGWYDEKTGEVHLYMPNIHDRYTAEKTIWHEVVGHKGMRELFGEDRFNRFLRDVWYDLDKPENADLKKLVMEEMKYNPFNVYNAIEEGIARLAEEGRGEAGFWRNLKNKVTDFLHEIGYRMAPNTKDVKYLLWLSKNLQKSPNDPYWKMRAEAVKYRLDHEDVPSVIEHDGMLYDNDGKIYKGLGDLPKAEYQEATDGEIHFRTTPSAGTALDRYHRSLDAHGYMFTESYMDSMLSLKNLMTAILPGKKIEDIASSENPYMLQNTMQGAMSDAAQMFERNVMKPLDKAMAQVLDAFDGKNDDEKIRNFNLYMITKHGLERNRILYVRDALKDMRMDEKKKKLADTIENDWNNEKATLDEKLERGDIDLKEYYKQMDDFIRTYVDETNKFDAGEHDYSGIHAIQEVEKNSDPYDDAEAIQSVMDSEGRMEDIKKGAVKDYWDKVKAATQYAIDCDYRNGLISRELHGHVSAMFNWYVPLRKYDEATAEDTYGYITEKGDPKSYIGKTIMRTRGHKYLSETNILAQIGAMGNRAIKNGGQNAIKQAFARFIRNNSNNNLVTETSVWYVSDPITQTTVERYPDIPDDATADEINQIVSDFNMEMKDLASKGLATKVYRRGRIGYKFQRAENKSQHIVDVMIAGKKHSFIVNGNPRAAQALNGLLENSAAKGIMKPLGSISRMMAQLCTSYNPEFVMRNIMRDAEFASSNVTTKEGARYGGLWAKYYAQLGLYKGASNISMKDLQGSTGLGLFAKYRNGTLDMNDKIQRYFKEFMENGGETGWVQIKNMKEWEKQYKQDVKGERSKVQRGGKMVRDFFFGNLENLNEVAENIARFSTYCASRDFGRSVVRSTYDAKEVSTNFNRHGSGDAIKSFKNGEMTGTKAAARWAYGFTSSYLRHCSMFFNAGIQSTNLLVKNLKNHPVGTSVNMLSIPFALGALGALLNNALIASEDEKDRNGVKDPYGELPDYVRRNNLCIYKGGGEFITIPLAIELRAFYGLGDLAAGLTFSPNVSGQKNPYLDAVGCMSQLVPVMDYLGNSSAGKKPLEETIKAISPSAIAPFIEWEQNSDWKGAPIERRGDWNENVPAWQRAYNGTPEGLKTLNKWVNAQTNDVAKGNEDMLGNGFLDMVTNPSMVNHFFGGIGGGAATFAERTLGAIKHGSDTETKDIPFVRSLLYTPSEQSSLQRTKSKWYNYKDEMEKTIANVDRLKSKNVPIDKRLTNVADYYNFQNSKDAAKVRVIELAEKQMKQWKKLRDKSGDNESIKFANENIDRIMMDAVEQLDKLN